MIDNIKISTKDFNHERLLKDPAFNFSTRVNTETGEILKNVHGNYKQEAFFYGLKINVYHNYNNVMTLSIMGSIHKFFNNGAHNYNDLVYSDLIITIDRLSKLFYINSGICKVSNVEIGVNINLPVKASKILRGLLSHRNKEFKSISMDNAEYYQVRHTNYYIKIYNKAKQYKAKGFQIKGELLRYELKYRKMVDLINSLNKKQIINRDYLVLADLKNINVLNVFSELLISKWQEILFYDHSISKKKLTNNQKQKLFAWSNKDYWLKLDKQPRSKQKKRLNDVISNHSQNLQIVVGDLIKNKIEILLKNRILFNQINNIQKDDLLTNTINEALTNKRLPFNTIYKEVNGISFEDFFSSENSEDIRLNYEVWINAPGEIPF